MSGYINRDTTIEKIRFEGIYGDGYSDEELENGIVGMIESIPAAEVRPVRRGKWILDEDPHDGDCRCSACLVAIDQMHERNHRLLNALTGGKWWTFYNYCPNCGADMRETEK